MTAYVIYEAHVSDADRFERYKAAAAPTVAAAGGRYVTRGGQTTSFEGAPPARVVVLEFPTLEAAERWYHSEEYQRATELRAEGCTARMFAVDALS
jgi:uncharacterized protein (DUF1330 family)